MALQHFVGHSQELALAAATAVTAEEREQRQKEVRPVRGDVAFMLPGFRTSDKRVDLSGPPPLLDGATFPMSHGGLVAVQAEKLDEKLRFIVEKIPDRRYHIMGSNAGAGSGEFHMYRAVRIF
jgi:hypothetical protein